MDSCVADSTLRPRFLWASWFRIQEPSELRNGRTHTIKLTYSHNPAAPILSCNNVYPNLDYASLCGASAQL